MIQGHIFGVVKLIGMKKLIFILFLSGMGMIHAQNDSLNNNEPKLLAARIGTGLLGYQGFERSSNLNITNYYFNAQATFNRKGLLKPGFDFRYRHNFDFISFGGYTPDQSLAGYVTMGLYESRRFSEFYVNTGLGFHVGKLENVKSFSVSPELMTEAGLSFKPLKQIGIGFHFRLTANPSFYTASVGTHISYCIPYKRSN